MVSGEIKEIEGTTTFQATGLIQPLLDSTEAALYKTPTPVQAEAIPSLLKGRDLLGFSNTGTGKTAAFLLPILQSLFLSKKGCSPKRCVALILVPTRELAVQIHKSVGIYGQFLRSISSMVVVGGVSQNPQVCSLNNGTHILIATPGRLIDLMGQGHVHLDQVQFFVLDEVDKMLEMGFLGDIRKVLAKLPKKRQTLFFSATMPDTLRSLASDFLTNPVKVECGSRRSPAEGIVHEAFLVHKPDKRPLLQKIFEQSEINRALVFTRTKYTAFKVDKFLKRSRISSDAIHSRKSQKERTLALERFKDKRIRVLVATDVVSRGIDVKNITHVINYDIPDLPESYIHRVGRTGRWGNTGAAVSFCDPGEFPLLQRIENLMGFKIKICSTHPFQIQSAAGFENLTHL
ncbi:MAG: DEAD/DEAH box helicase, partial [Nitrospinota bacterium]